MIITNLELMNKVRVYTNMTKDMFIEGDVFSQDEDTIELGNLDINGSKSIFIDKKIIIAYMIMENE